MKLPFINTLCCDVDASGRYQSLVFGAELQHFPAPGKLITNQLWRILSLASPSTALPSFCHLSLDNQTMTVSHLFGADKRAQKKSKKETGDQVGQTRSAGCGTTKLRQPHCTNAEFISKPMNQENVFHKTVLLAQSGLRFNKWCRTSFALRTGGAETPVPSKHCQLSPNKGSEASVAQLRKRVVQ